MEGNGTDRQKQLPLCAVRLSFPVSFSRLFRRTKILEQLTDLRVNVAPHQRNTANQLRVTSNHAHSWVVSHGLLRNFGLKVGMVGTVRFEARIKELVENLPDLAVLVEPLLVVRRVLREQFVILHRRLLAIVRDDEVCRRLMTTPGVGPVVALTYRATVDVPARFRKSKSVGAVFGLTCSKYQSGEIDRSGRISRCGDEMMRVMLYEAAQSMLYSKKWSWLKAWAMQIARRRGMKKAIVALARRLAVIMHRIYGPAARCKGIRTEWSFWSALIYPASRGSSCSGPSWLSAHT